VPTGERAAVQTVPPLYQHLNSSNDGAIVAICELARYLREFASDPAITTVVNDLRSDKFEATFLELALAHRWKKAGASVTLQPPVPSGVADFAAVVDGTRFVVEASTFPADDFSKLQVRAGTIVAETLESVVKNRVPVAIKVVINEHTEGDFEGNLRKAVREVCTALLSALGEGARKMSGNFVFCSVDAEQITGETETITDSTGTPAPIGATDWSLCMRVCARQKPPGSFAYEALAGPEGPESVRLFLRYPRPDQETLSGRIAKKLRKQKRQLKGVDDPRLVILDVTALASEGLNVSDEQLRAELERVMANTPELMGVWLLSIVFPARARHEYYGPFIKNSSCAFALPANFFRQLVEQEGISDFINDVGYLPESRR
jgi:hypothetical protein